MIEKASFKNESESESEYESKKVAEEEEENADHLGWRYINRKFFCWHALILATLWNKCEIIHTSHVHTRIAYIYAHNSNETHCIISVWLKKNSYFFVCSISFLDFWYFAFQEIDWTPPSPPSQPPPPSLPLPSCVYIPFRNFGILTSSFSLVWDVDFFCISHQSHNKFDKSVCAFDGPSKVWVNEWDKKQHIQWRAREREKWRCMLFFSQNDRRKSRSPHIGVFKYMCLCVSVCVCVTDVWTYTCPAYMCMPGLHTMLLFFALFFDIISFSSFDSHRSFLFNSSSSSSSSSNA